MVALSYCKPRLAIMSQGNLWELPTAQEDDMEFGWEEVLEQPTFEPEMGFEVG